VSPVDIVEAAIALGLPVFPCREDKRPATRRGFKDAEREPDAIRALWRANWGPLIGMPTGEPSGFYVLDIDRAGLGWFDERADRGRIPATRVHRTRSGGLHVVFLDRLELMLGNTAGKIDRGVDTRGTGGYCIWPPSPGYEIEEDSPPALLPLWLVNSIRKERGSSAAPPPAAAPRPLHSDASLDERRDAALLDFVRSSPTGQGNDRLFWAACRAAAEGKAELLEELVVVAHGRGTPINEAQATVASARRTAWHDQGRR
jgi:hypothetical protein